MEITVKIAGTALLLLTCGGAGFAVYTHQLYRWQRLHTMARLFEYWQGLLSYQALAGEELLRRAETYDEFRSLQLGQYRVLEELSLDDMQPKTLRLEIQSGLQEMASAPRTLACRTLHRMAELCESEARVRRQEAGRIKSLGPRLGVCLGALIAILLW